MKMKTAEEWPREREACSCGRCLETYRAIQRDALEAAGERCADVGRGVVGSNDYHDGFRAGALSCSGAIRALMPGSGIRDA